jgi:hypothetical protein
MWRPASCFRRRPSIHHLDLKVENAVKQIRSLLASGK